MNPDTDSINTLRRAANYCGDPTICGPICDECINKAIASSEASDVGSTT
jgi:hypothetical protein